MAKRNILTCEATSAPPAREARASIVQDALQRTFGLKAYWDDLERDVYVLSATSERALVSSNTAPSFQYMRGKITLRKQGPRTDSRRSNDPRSRRRDQTLTHASLALSPPE